jgi:tetratricopeptide (TPR) repeat protein
MVHLLCGTLTFWLGGRLFTQARLRTPWLFALYAAALWLVAPLLVSTVLYVIQRMAQLAALFTLAGLLTYVIGRQRVSLHRVSGSLLILAAFVFWMPLAAYSKETGLLLPLLAFVIEVFFFRFHGDRYARGLLVTVFGILLLAPVLIGILKLALDPGFITGGYARRDFTFAERVLTEPRILFSYVSALLFPYGPAMGLYQDDYPLSHGLFSPPTTILALLGWLAALALPWMTASRTVRFLGFGVVFFLAGHALESTIIAVEVYFEHRNYLPSVGVFLALVAAAHQLTLRVEHQRALLALLALLPLAYAVSTYQRALSWQSSNQILLTAERAHPDSRRLNSELAVFHARRGDLERALKHLDKAESLYRRPTAATTLQRVLLHCLAGARIPVELLTELDQLKTLDYSPPTIAALRYVNDYLLSDRCDGLQPLHFAETLERAATGAPAAARWDAHFELAKIYDYLGRPKDAIEHLNQASRIYPHRLAAGLIAVKLQLESNDLEGARTALDALKAADNGTRRRDTAWIRLYDEFLETVEQSPEKPVKIEIE